MSFQQQDRYREIRFAHFLGAICVQVALGHNLSPEDLFTETMKVLNAADDDTPIGDIRNGGRNV